MSNIEDNFDEIEAQILARLKNSDDPYLTDLAGKLENRRESAENDYSHAISLKTSQKLTPEQRKQLMGLIDNFVNSLNEQGLIVGAEIESD